MTENGLSINRLRPEPLTEQDKAHLLPVLLRAQLHEMALKAAVMELAARDGKYGWRLDMNTWAWIPPEEEHGDLH